MTSKGWRPMWTTVSASRRTTWGAHYDRADAERQAIDLKKDHPNEDWYVCEVRPVGEIVEPRPAYEVREVYTIPNVRPGSEAAETLMSDDEVALRSRGGIPPMTTEESMESLDRVVEEARRKIAADMDGATVLALGSAGMRRLSVNVDALIAAVSAKARAEERERHREGLERLKSALLAQIGSHVRPPFDRLPMHRSEDWGTKEGRGMSACLGCGAQDGECGCMDSGPECVLCGYAEWEPLTPWKRNYHSEPDHEFACGCGFVGDTGWHDCSLVLMDTNE